MFDNFNVNFRKNEGFLTYIPCILIPEYGQSNAPLSVKGISRIPFRTEKEDYVRRLSTISERIFQKIAFPFDLKRKCPDFFAKW